MNDPANDPAGAASNRAAAWIYSGVWQMLVGWFRVPRRAPSLPATDGDTPHAFRPDLAFVRYLKLWFWIVVILMDLTVLALWIALAAWEFWVAAIAAPLAIAIALLPVVIGYVAIHLRYDTTWYVMSDRSLRIRRGIWIIHEITITFENVQNVKVQQGPVQRLFGVSNLIVETAGGGGDPSNGVGIKNQGVIEGIADPQAMRDRILARLRSSRSAGLGDDDPSAAPAAAGWTAGHVAVLRQIHDELRAMRTT